MQQAKLFVVQRAGGFLAVSGDKRDGFSLIDEIHRRLYLMASHLQLLGDCFYQIHIYPFPNL